MNPSPFHKHKNNPQNENKIYNILSVLFYLKYACLAISKILSAKQQRAKNVL